MRSSVFVALSALSLASAKNFTIDPAAVSLTTRSSWCVGQENTCSVLCSGSTKANTCTPSTLDYNCLCSANSSAPGLEYYTQTMPTFICKEAYAECITANPNNATGQEACVTDIEDYCGTLNSDDFTGDTATTSSASSSAAATSTGSASASASAEATVSATSSTAGAAATKMATLGNGAAAIAVGVFAYLL